MKILVDAMSGDNAPSEILKGAAEAAAVFDAEIGIAGDPETVRAVAERDGTDISRLRIVPSSSVVEMTDDPLCVMKEKADSSISVGLRSLAAGEWDAFVSAGNTGALLAGGTLIVRKIKGVRRAAIGTVLPMTRPVLLCDSGANIEMMAEDMLQFAVMASAYYENMFGTAEPRVGLLNNGAEETKGGKVRTEAYALLKDAGVINFIGNVEPRYIPDAPCEVLVTDGFTGNAILKYTEGLGLYIFGKLKKTLTGSILNKLAAAALKPSLKAMKDSFDPSEYGGAPLLGLAKTVIKSHGSSDAREIKNAVRQAIDAVKSGLPEATAEKFAEIQRKKAETQ